MVRSTLRVCLPFSADTLQTPSQIQRSVSWASLNLYVWWLTTIGALPITGVIWKFQTGTPLSKGICVLCSQEHPVWCPRGLMLDPGSVRCPMAEHLWEALHKASQVLLWAQASQGAVSRQVGLRIESWVWALLPAALPLSVHPEQNLRLSTTVWALACAKYLVFMEFSLKTSLTKCQIVLELALFLMGFDMRNSIGKSLKMCLRWLFHNHLQPHRDFSYSRALGICCSERDLSKCQDCFLFTVASWIMNAFLYMAALWVMNAFLYVVASWVMSAFSLHGGIMGNECFSVFSQLSASSIKSSCIYKEINQTLSEKSF